LHHRVIDTLSPRGAMSPGEPDLPLLSIVLPAYNEEALLEENVTAIIEYLETLETEFRWEIIIVNDGSRDATAEISNRLAAGHPSILTVHHPRNFGLGQAMSYGFANTAGDYVITLDMDLSYDVEHIGRLARTIRDGGARMVLASPYMEGGTIRNVPFLRRHLSVLGNRFLRYFAKGRFSTLTCMTRAYDGPFIRALNLRAMGMDAMPETVYKAMILNASIDEIPAELDWAPQLAVGKTRRSSMRIFRHILSTIFSGFIFRPFLYFIVPGLLLGAFSAYVNYWVFVHYFEALAELRGTGQVATVTGGLALAYEQYPHTFVFGLMTAVLATQLIGLGVLSLQNKQYYEELFHLGSMRVARSTASRPGRERSH
jgi:glycosyltransferase involved in cell wall biosynthesis